MNMAIKLLMAGSIGCMVVGGLTMINERQFEKANSEDKLLTKAQIKKRLRRVKRENKGLKIVVKYDQERIYFSDTSKYDVLSINIIPIAN